MHQKIVYYAGLVFILAFFSYIYLDVTVANYFYHLRNPIKEFFSQYVTKFGKSEWILIGSLLIYFFYKKRNNVFAYQGLFIFSSIALSGILVNILKPIFSRYRPKAYFQDGLFGFDVFSFKVKYIFNSFPSGHSVTAMGFAIALALLFPRYKIAALVFGMIVASSRFVVTAHYVSDVLVGGLLGGVVSYGLYHYYFKTKISKQGFE